jgi:predicted O-methyltransferase YrrM
MAGPGLPGGVTTIRTWHGVLSETDLEASAPANIDLACMLIAFQEPKVVVEAGTFRGHFAFAAANILRQIESGMVYTADPVDGTSELLTQPMAQRLLPYLHVHRGDFLDMLADVPDPIDFAYIDASSKENPHMRWEHARAVHARMRPGGLILVDDTEGEWGDATRFRQWGDLHLKGHRGLTIIQKANV